PPPVSPLFPYTTLFRSRRVWTVGAVGFAAAAALVLLVRPAQRDHDFNNIKGVAAEVRISDGHSQRAAVAGSTQSLRTGERVRLRSEEHTSELQSRVDLV